MDKFNSFINSLYTPKKTTNMTLASSKPVNMSYATPKPTQNMTMATSAPAATSPVKTTPKPTYTAPTYNPTPKDTFISNLSSSNLSSPNTTQNTPSVTVEKPKTAFDKYLELLNSEQVKSASEKSIKDTQRLADIQSRNEKRSLDTRVGYETALDTPGGLKSGAEASASAINRRGSAESAYGALEESAAARTAGVSRDAYNDAIARGKTVYEAELEQEKVNKKEGFSLGKDQVRYEFNPTTNSYEKIGGGSSITTPSSYEAGANPTVDSYIKGIRDNTFKIGDVPDKYKDLVAQGLSQKTSQLTESGKEVLGIVDALLQNPKLSNISGPIDQALGGMFGKGALAKNYYNQLVGILKLDNRQKLKGSGAISDFEFKVLGQAATALGRNLKDEDFRNELQKLKDKLSGNAPLPTTPTNGDVWKSPQGEEYEFKDGYWEETSNKSFNSVGKTTASNIPQRNLNPGNVKKGGLADNLAVGVDKQGHLIFPDEETGFKALTMDLEAKINGQSRYLPPNPTIAQLGKVYAEDKKWGEKVAKILGISPLTPTKNIPLNQLAQAIAKQEGYYA